MATSFNTKWRSAILVTAGLLYGSTPTGSVLAADLYGDTVISHVGTAGLDLAKPADAALLRHRIAVAANDVCAEILPGEAHISPAFESCCQDAFYNARKEVNLRVAAARSSSLVASGGPR